MKKLVEAALQNQSSKEVFLFRVTCASCGTDYGNKPMRFSKADTAASTPNEEIIYNALYETELRTVRQSAICNIAEHMNYCPICKRLVCNQCFLICEELDMCKQCAAKLQQKGLPVAAGAIDAAV